MRKKFRLDRIKEKEDPWDEQWWLNPQWKKYIQLEDSELSSRIDLLRDAFDSSWLNSLGSDPWRHPLIQAVAIGEGISNIRHILALSQQIKNLSGVNGYDRVLDDYKAIKTSKSAQLELFMASAMKDVGYEVSFIVPRPRKGKTPDILVGTGKYEFVIECKSLDDAKAENWIEVYRRHFSDSIIDTIPKNIACYYYPENPEVDIRNYGYPETLESPIIAAEIETLIIRNKIKQFTRHFQIPAYTYIEGKGHLLLHHESEDIRTEIGLPELNRAFLMKRLFSNGVEKANAQIEAYEIPGIAVVFYSGASQLGHVESTFNQIIQTDPSHYRYLMGVLMLPMQNILEYIHPYWLNNSSADLSAKDIGLIDKLDSLFKPISSND